MKLVIKNFGPIKEGSIDLSKRFFLFVGYNNTGKTYLSKLIYDIFNIETIQEFANSDYNTFKQKEQKELVLDDNIIKNLLSSFATYLKDVVIHRTLKISNNDNNSFIVEKLDIRFEYTLEEVKEDELSSSTAIGFKTTEKNNDSSIEVYSLKKEKKSMLVNFNYFSNEDIYTKLPADFFENIPKKKFEEEIKSIKKDVSKTFVVSLLNLLLQNKEKPFFLPSNRIFILENAEELSRQESTRKKELSEILVDFLDSKNEAKQKILSNFLAKKSESEHSIHVTYLIEEILKLRSNKDDEYIQNGTTYYNNFVESMSDILGGEVVMVKPSAVSNWAERFQIAKNKSPLGSPVKLNLASSSVNQLSTLFLFFKYWAKPDKNFLMIDEPEENLHPESQIELINLLLNFINFDNRLLITTHSPLVAEMINNYLVLGQLKNKDALIKELNLPNININIKNSSIYFFNNGTITEHLIGKYGTIFTSFKIAQEKIYKVSDALNDLMFSQLNKSK